MPTLDAFDTPGRVRDLGDADRAAWDARVRDVFAEFTGDFPQIYDPTETDTPADAQPAPIVWAAFPARLLPDATSEEARWRQADEDRDEQDEYCEWAVERDAGGVVTAVTFTTEVPEYWDHLHGHDPDRLVALYKELVDPGVELGDLRGPDGYDRLNAANRGVPGRIAHLSQPNSTLRAAVELVALATVQRDRDGVPVTTKQALAGCAGLGDPFRNSDPQIAAVVNGAAATGDQITLGDPPGLYLDRLDTTGMVTPDGADPAGFWTIERGEPGHVVRASFRVPPGHGYRVGDITLDGRPIAFGGQLADRVSVRIDGLVKAGDVTPRREPCNG